MTKRLARRRPALQEVSNIRNFAGEALDVLIELMRGTPQRTHVMNRQGDIVSIDVAVPPSVRMSCAMEVLNRTYGPPGYDLSPEGGASAETNAVPVEDRIKALHARYADPDAAPPKPKSPVVDLPEDGTLQPAPPPTPMPADAFAPVEDSPGEEPPSAGPDTMGQQEVI